MKVLIVRCQQGPVAWRLTPLRATGGLTLRCLNDGFTVLAGLATDADIVITLRTVASHSAAIQGAVQDIAQIDLG